MKAIYKKRLLILAKFLRTVPRERFKMQQWVTGQFCGKAQEPKHNECGTAACVIGWACTIPAFKRDGLFLHSFRPTWYDENDVPRLTPKYKRRTSWDAVRAFFGLPPETSATLDEFPEDYLFGAHNSNSPTQAAKRIERYIKLEEAGKL